MKRLVLGVLFLIILLPIVAVNADPEATVIRVVPVGEPHTGLAIITDTTPAFLKINVTSGAHSPMYDVWLLFVVDSDTWDNLNSISITGTDGPTTIVKGDFSGALSSSSLKIPGTADTNCLPPSGYPGCIPQIQYELGAILSQMSQVYATTTVYYVLVYAFDMITYPTEEFFSVTVDSTHVNVLILAQGTEVDGNPLTNNSPFSGSTLVILELGPVLLALASFSAFALYAVKRRKYFH